MIKVVCVVALSGLSAWLCGETHGPISLWFAGMSFSLVMAIPMMFSDVEY